MKKIYLSLFASALLFTACEKDEPKDEQAPEISVSGLHESGLVVGEEVVTITATDAGGIEKVELYLGTELISTLNAGPYEATINSTSYADGEYELKTVVYDKAGNLKEWKQPVKVSNVLMSIDLSSILPVWTKTEEERHLVVSDRNGSLLASAKVNGNENTFPINSPEDFYDEEVVLTVISKALNGNLRIESVGGIDRGTNWAFKEFISRYELEDAQERTPVGSVGIKVHNMVEESINLSGQDGSREWLDEYNQGESQVSIYAQPTTFYLTKETYGNELPEAYSYLVIPNVEAGKSYSILADFHFKTNLQEHSFNIPNSENIGVYAWASFEAEGEYNIRLGQIGNESKPGKYFMPSDVDFSKFMFNVYREEGSTEFGFELYSESSQLNYGEIQAGFKYKEADSRGASLEISNPDFDFYQVEWTNYHLDSYSPRIEWTFVAPAHLTELNLVDLALIFPELDASVINSIKPDLTFAIDFSEINTYEELMPEFMIQMQGVSLNGVQSYKYMYNFESPVGMEGGRIQALKRPVKNPFLIERAKK